MTDRLTRRQLLAAGAAAGASLALAGCGDDAPPTGATTAPAPPPPAPAPTPTATTALVPLPSERMLKGVSLIGDVNPYDDSLGVRPYLLGGARLTEVVTLWLVWPSLQPQAPRPLTREASFAQLSTPTDPDARRRARRARRPDRAGQRRRPPRRPDALPGLPGVEPPGDTEA